MSPPSLISASRRTDIPAFYALWFMNRIRAGYAVVPNPFNGKDARVSLAPDDVTGIVFWSRCYAPLLPHLPELADRGYRFYFHYTITGLPRRLEPRAPDWRQAVRTFSRLSACAGPGAVLWRFDPIVLADGTGSDDLSVDGTIRRFRCIASALANLTTRCTFSFAHPYAKVRRRFAQAGVPAWRVPVDIQRSVVRAMADIADRCGIHLHACCQDPEIASLVGPAACVDDRIFAELYPGSRPRAAPAPTRPGCGCLASRDIGIYDTCPFGCLYCYANQSGARSRWRRHDPSNERLLPRL